MSEVGGGRLGENGSGRQDAAQNDQRCGRLDTYAPYCLNIYYCFSSIPLIKMLLPATWFNPCKDIRISKNVDMIEKQRPVQNSKRNFGSFGSFAGKSLASH